MWIALRPFRYRGTLYNAGDQVPAEKWMNRRALSVSKRIRQVVDLSDPKPEEVPDHTKMKLADLKAYAESLGVENLEDYPTRKALIEKIDSLSAPPVENEKESTESAEGEKESAVGVEEDLFADLDGEEEEEGSS